ncbi:MAG: hypothetical protein E6R07_10515 [Nevskiaceae bacterium]|nr:MAG: hypothetical protein E6R07_10515 [Nevskiaceae bacterium]
MNSKRRNHYDVTNTVRISHPADVCKAVKGLLAPLYPHVDLSPIDHAFDVFTRLYAGTLPGYVGCDTWYHDAQHSLDCALAMARLLDGHERHVAPGKWLGARRGLLGVIIALFHDAGYIRRTGDSASNGAEFTLTHVRRSGEFLATLLPQIGFADQVELTHNVVHFTGYEIALDEICVSHPQDRMLGFLLGTADILAQTSDRCYLEKCRDFLYREFEICGLAGKGRPNGPKPIYRSVRELMEKTPEYNRKLWEERLDGYFRSAWRYMDLHFEGSNPYVEQIRLHLRDIARMIRSRRFAELRRRPVAIGAPQMRRCIRAPRRPSSRGAARANV